MMRYQALLKPLALGALALASLPVWAASAVDGSTSVTLGPMEGTGEFYVQVPEGATHLEVQIAADNPDQEDVDLFLRYGEPFNIPANNQVENLLPQSLYYAIGDRALEYVEVTFASTPPVSPGRWYLAVFNAHGSRTSDVTITADVRSEAEPTLKPLDIQVSYTDPQGKGFNDTTAFSPIGGNDATTLGEARRNAFEEAIRILEESFTSPVPIQIAAGFDQTREGENGEDVEVCPDALACAGPTSIAAGFPGAQVAGTWYPRTTVPRLAGTDYCRLGFESCKNPNADVFVSFNKESDLNNGAGWWYGLDRNPAGFSGDDYDFIAVAMHEMLHGLGYLSLTDVKTGEKQKDNSGTPRDDIYTEQLRWRKNGNLLNVNNLSNQQRANAFKSSGDLVWGGAFGQAWWDEARSSGLIFSSEQRPVLYAPDPPEPGSSVSHIRTADLMNYTGHVPTANPSVEIRQSGVGLGSAYGFLRDAGWDAVPKPKLEGPVDNEVPRGMWYDRARDGHGFDFQRVGDNWFLVFFTYDDAGNPEWYLAVGTLVDGVFSADLNRYTYDRSSSDPLSEETVGTVELDLNADASSAACDDGVNRGNASMLARFSWAIDAQSGDWCAEPFQLPGSAPAENFTGHWFAGQADDGWGMTIQVRDFEGKQILVDTLYFYDDQGNPRWAQGVTTDFLNRHNEQALDMQQFAGYPRTSDCTPDMCSLGDGAGSSAGPLRLRLKKPLLDPDAGSRASVDVDYLGPEGGTWFRDFVTIQMISDPS